MFPWASQASQRAAPPQDDGPSLTTILHTQALRTQFALLVAVSADTVRRNLASIFDSSVPLFQAQYEEARVQPGGGERSSVGDLLEQNRARRIEELSSAESQKIQNEAMGHVDKWRRAVLERIGKILKVTSDSVRTGRRDAAEKAKDERMTRRIRQVHSWHQHQANDTEHTLDPKIEQDFHAVDLETSLIALDESERTLLLHCLLLLLLSLENYSAYSRVLLQHVAKSLRLPARLLAERESLVARGLLDSAASHMSAEGARQQQAQQGATSRKWKVGLATVGGAVLIGVTGGLAAPVLAGAAGYLMGGIGLGALATLLGPLATNFVLVGGLFGAFGGMMTGGIVEKYAKEVEEFNFLPLHPSTPATSPSTSSAEFLAMDLQQAKRSHRLRVAIGITGFLSANAESDIHDPWLVLNPNTCESFCLRYEPSALTRIGRKLEALIAMYAVETVTWAVLRRTLLAGLAAGLWPIGLIRAANMLDSPWSIAQTRSDKAGEVLAHALIDKVQGERPVTLVGYSLGARVIWSCLQTLADRGAYGLVEQAIFIGAPITVDSFQWRKARAVVAGRIINAYSTDDWILGLVYRSNALQWGVAGLQRIIDVEGIENINLGTTTNGHFGYRFTVGQILQKAGFEDLDLDAVDREIEALRKKQEREKTGGSKKSVDINTMVGAHQGADGIVLADNTKPLIDIEQDEDTVPEWQRPSSTQSDPFASLLDLDNDEPSNSPRLARSRPAQDSMVEPKSLMVEAKSLSPLFAERKRPSPSHATHNQTPIVSYMNIDSGRDRTDVALFAQSSPELHYASLQQPSSISTSSVAETPEIFTLSESEIYSPAPESPIYDSESDTETEAELQMMEPTPEAEVDEHNPFEKIGSLIN